MRFDETSFERNFIRFFFFPYELNLFFLKKFLFNPSDWMELSRVSKRVWDKLSLLMDEGKLNLLIKLGICLKI